MSETRSSKYSYLKLFTPILVSIKGSQTGSHALNDSADRLDLLITSINTERDLNESISSKSIQEDTTDNTNLVSSQRTTNVPLTGPTSVILTSNTSRTSLSSDVSQVLGHSISGRLSSILEQRRRPDMLLKRWNKRQTITAKNPKEPLPLPVSALICFCKVSQNRTVHISGKRITFIACG